MHALLISFVLTCSALLTMCDPLIGIAMIESTQAFPFLVSSRNTSDYRRFGTSLRNIVGGAGFSVPFQTSRSVNPLKELLGASSNSYPTSIQHKIPHLARALGNTRYVTIAEDPTLVYPWKATSSGQWNRHLSEDNENTNSINHSPNEGYPDGEREIMHHRRREQDQIEPPSRPYQQKRLHPQRPSGEQRPSHGNRFYHDPGRNEDKKSHNPNPPHVHRQSQVEALPPQGSRLPSQKEAHHFHYHARRREHRRTPPSQGPTSTPNSSSEEDPHSGSSSGGKEPDDWSLNLRYGRQRGQTSEAGCSSQRPSQRRQQEQSTQTQNRSNQRPQEQQNNSNAMRPSNPPRGSQPTRSYADEMRSRYNDLPVLRAKWTNQPYRQQESRRISNVQMVHDRPEWELAEQSFHTPHYNDPRGRKVIKNLTTIIEEEFDKSPLLQDYHKPYQHSEYRYTGFPSFDHGEWTSPRRQKGARRTSVRTINSDNFYSAFMPSREERPPHYMHQANHETQEDDIEETGSGDDDTDVGIVAIGDRTNNQTDIKRINSSSKDHKTNSSQDFLVGGELRFPDQNGGGLAELTELLKEVPEIKSTIPYNHNGTRGHLVRTTKNIEVTREMFIDGKYREPSSRQQQFYPERNINPAPNQNLKSWSPLAQTLSIINPSINSPSNLQSKQQGQQLQGSIQQNSGRLISNKPGPNVFRLDSNTGYKEQQHLHKQPSFTSPEHQYRFQHSGGPAIRQVDAPKFLNIGVQGNQPVPKFSSEGKGPLRKRIRKIQTHTTIEVLPVAPTPNDTELTTTPSYAPYSSEESDYESRERPSFYSDDYPDNQVQDENATLTATDYESVQNTYPSPVPTETTTVTSEATTTPESSTERPTVPPKKLRRQLTIRTRPHSQSAKSPETDIPATLPPTRIYMTKIRKPDKKDRPKATHSQKPCAYNDCPGKINLTANTAESGRFGEKSSRPHIQSGETIISSVTPRPPKSLPAYTVLPTAMPATTSAEAAPSNRIRKQRQRRKKVTVAPDTIKETAPVALKVIESEDQLLRGGSAPVAQLANRPAVDVSNHKMNINGKIKNVQQFRRRKASDEELQSHPQGLQLAEATDENPDNEMRVQFHLQGFSGPDSYRYGFHTADRYNPIERFEERDGEGHVRGHYSYIDPTGKRVTVNYAADQNGFQIVKADTNGGSAERTDSRSSPTNNNEETDSNSATKAAENIVFDSGSDGGNHVTSMEIGRLPD